MIEYALLFGLGFLTAILAGLLLAPAIHRRIVKFTEDRILATMPGQDGTMCRRFQQTLTVAGRTHSGVGVACFRNNAWQLGT